MATYQEVRCQIETLSTSEQLQLLEELAAIVRHRTSPTLDSEATSLRSKTVNYARWQGVSALEAARSVMGVVGNGPPDLSTNPKYMEGFGQ
jgi:hypothetical protein